MGLIRISRADFDPVTMLLHFDATARIGACLTTVVSSIRLAARPRGESALRWAIMQKLRDVTR
ncbi:hypothetical protein [Devosia beringensis]|uniref:hypothetical protein n=1 Tax=Devosia beringensis TaxID=2657486 RepID=UPI00186B63AD|nr:hypothetical protein [Devosia beringensis]